MGPGPNPMEQDADTGMVALGALRYALGRRSYAVSTIIEWTMRHWYSLSLSDRAVIQRDITAEVNSGCSLGDDCDEASWRNFLTWIEAQTHTPGPTTHTYVTMASMGKIGGSSASPAKVKASRENGKKGGRPRREQSRLD